MNKNKCAIITNRVKFVRKMAGQIQPFVRSSKWIQRWYVENAKTPLQVSSEVLQMKDSKVHAIYYLIKDTTKDMHNPFGNLFDIKFPMVMYVCNMDSMKGDTSYSSFLEMNHPGQRY